MYICTKCDSMLLYCWLEDHMPCSNVKWDYFPGFVGYLLQLIMSEWQAVGVVAVCSSSAGYLC